MSSNGVRIYRELTVLFVALDKMKIRKLCEGHLKPGLSWTVQPEARKIEVLAKVHTSLSNTTTRFIHCYYY